MLLENTKNQLEDTDYENSRAIIKNTVLVN